MNMMNSGGAIQRAVPAKHHHHAGIGVFVMEMRECGEFMVYATAAPVAVSVNDAPHEFEYDEERKSVTFFIPPAIQSGDGEVVLKF